MLDDDGPKGRVTSTSTPSSAAGSRTPAFDGKLTQLRVYLKTGGVLNSPQTNVKPAQIDALVEILEGVCKSQEGYVSLDLPNGGKQLIPAASIDFIEVLHA